jgi:transposase
MNRRQVRYSPEFIEEALELLQNSGKRLTRLAKDLGIAPSTLIRWQKEARTVVKKSQPKGELTSEERAELIRLRREIHELKQERDFLKKASAFFAKESAKMITK